MANKEEESLLSFDDIALPGREGKPRAPARQEMRPATKDDSPISKALKIFDSSGDASFPMRTLGAAFSGLGKNPIVGAAMRNLVRGGPFGVVQGADDREEVLNTTLEAIEKRIENSPNQDFVRVSELIGEFGPEFALFGMAAGGGRGLASKGIQRVAPELAGRAGPVGKQFAKVAFKSLEDAGELYPRAVPKIQQAAEVLGEAVGAGGYAGISEYIDSGDVTSATRSAALVAVLTGGAATTLRAGGKLVSRKGRELNLFDVEKGTGREAYKSRKMTIDELWAGQAEKTKEQIAKVLKVKEHTKAAASFYKRTRAQPKLPGMPQEEWPKRVFSDEQIGKALKLRTTLRQQRQARRAFNRITEDMVIPSNYTKGPRLEPGQSWETLEKLMLQVGKTPEAFFGQFGKTFAQFGQAWSRAESVSSIGRGIAESTVNQITREISGALGLKKTPKSGKFALPIVHAYEKGGIPGVRQFMQSDPLGNPLGTERMVNAFRMVEHGLKDYNELALMGAEPVMTAKQLFEFGNKAYWPHSRAAMSDAEFEKRLAASFMKEAKAKGETMTSEQATLKAREHAGSGPSFGLARSGTIDYTRTLKGSLQEKVTGGAPLNDDPMVGLFEHLTNVTRRAAFGKEFGFKGEIAENMIAMVEAETNVRTASVARVMVDHAINRKFEDRALVALADSMSSLQIGMKLPLAVLANISQSSVTATQSGIYKTLNGNIRALKVLLKGEENDEILRAVALQESLMGVMGDVFFEGAPRTPFVSFARSVLKWSGFDAVEKFNRLSAGGATYYDVQDTMIRAWRGTLRGNSLDQARRRMGTYGLNLGKMMQRARAAGDINAAMLPGEMETAIFRGAQVSQFIPSPTRKPLGWQGRVYGRVLTQFKTFALGYGRFMRDRVAGEAGRGNYEPLITWLGVSQPSGEFVNQTQSWARRRERPDDGIERALDNASAIGGLALVQSAFVAARYGSGLEWMAGPTVGPASQMAFDLMSGRVDSVIMDVMREPIVTVGIDAVLLGALTEDFVDEYLEAYKRSSIKPVKNAPSIDEIRLPRKGFK